MNTKRVFLLKHKNTPSWFSYASMSAKDIFHLGKIQLCGLVFKSCGIHFFLSLCGKCREV